jgi:hypothetical protein
MATLQAAEKKAAEARAPVCAIVLLIDYSPDYKGYCYLDLSTNCNVISRRIVFDEACFPFATSPHLTNDYEFLYEIDLVLSPIRRCLGAGPSTTTAGGLNVPVVEASGPTATPGGPPTRRTCSSTAPLGGLTAPPGSLIACIVEAGGQTAPPGGPTTRVAEVDGPIACPMTSTTSPVPHAAMTTPASPSAPLAALMILTSTSVPRVTQTTHPVTSSMVPVSPLATQPVPHVLPAGAVPVSPMVHLHPMWT